MVQEGKVGNHNILHHMDWTATKSTSSVQQEYSSADTIVGHTRIYYIHMVQYRKL